MNTQTVKDWRYWRQGWWWRFREAVVAFQVDHLRRVRFGQRLPAGFSWKWVGGPVLHWMRRDRRWRWRVRIRFTVDGSFRPGWSIEKLVNPQGPPLHGRFRCLIGWHL